MNFSTSISNESSMGLMPTNESVSTSSASASVFSERYGPEVRPEIAGFVEITFQTFYNRISNETDV